MAGEMKKQINRTAVFFIIHLINYNVNFTYRT